MKTYFNIPEEKITQMFSDRDQIFGRHAGPHTGPPSPGTNSGPSRSHNPAASLSQTSFQQFLQDFTVRWTEVNNEIHFKCREMN